MGMEFPDNRRKADDSCRSTMQHHRDAAIPVAAVLEGKRDDVGGQGRVIIRCRRNLALCGAMLTENPARPSFGNAKFSNNMIHTGPATRGDLKFPRAASARIILSSVRSETARRSRAFSVSSSFSRLTFVLPEGE